MFEQNITDVIVYSSVMDTARNSYGVD